MKLKTTEVFQLWQLVLKSLFRLLFLELKTHISNCQFGFRSNRSTTDAIFILQNAINVSQTPLFICFIDLKAAYDWINRDMLFKVLDIRIKSPILVNILKIFFFF